VLDLLPSLLGYSSAPLRSATPSYTANDSEGAIELLVPRRRGAEEETARFVGPRSVLSAPLFPLFVSGTP
jgi:hypothetical protein